MRVAFLYKIGFTSDDNGTWRKGCVQMSSEYSLKISPEQAKETPMVDLAFMILKAVNTPMYYRDMMQEIAKVKGISNDEVMRVIAQLYTEINIDGRFACVGTNLWGLKRWYPVEKAEDAMGNTKRPRIINDEDDDLDDEDLFDEEDDRYSADEEDYDLINEDSDDLFDADDADEAVDEEVGDEMLEDEDDSEENVESDDLDESEEDADDFADQDDEEDR